MRSCPPQNATATNIPTGATSTWQCTWPRATPAAASVINASTTPWAITASSANHSIIRIPPRIFVILACAEVREAEENGLKDLRICRTRGIFLKAGSTLQHWERWRMRAQVALNLQPFIEWPCEVTAALEKSDL